MKKQLTGWRKRIAAAKKRGYFTDYDGSLAGDWKSCAVGEARKVFGGQRPGLLSGSLWFAPIDEKYHDLGTRFDLAIIEDNFDLALKLLKRIESGR